MTERKRKTYILREHLFSLGEVKDVDYPVLGKTLSEYAAEKFDGEIVDEMPKPRIGETTLILRSSHTCLPRLGVDALVKKAEKTGENIFFGAGWVAVSSQNLSLAKYEPLYGGATFLSSADLPYVLECIRLEIIKRHLKRGVLIESDKGVYIHSTVKIGSGAYIAHDVTLKGNTTVESGAFLQEYTIIEDGYIAEGAQVGPFARLRKGSVIGKNAKIGNFVEIKNALIGEGTKAAHLSYVGDAEVGKACNIGCGAIFVNYDGKNKRRSKAEDGCFIGSNANVIAPVTLKKGSYLAAGSTLTKDLPENALCVARSRETVKEGRGKNYYSPDCGLDGKA